MKTYAKIMHGQIAFPMHFSKQAVDLIRRLLHAKPTKRLGVLKGGARLVKDHLWFKGFDWYTPIPYQYYQYNTNTMSLHSSIRWLVFIR